MIQSFIPEDDVSPEGLIKAPAGKLRIDRTQGRLFIKRSPEHLDTDWLDITSFSGGSYGVHLNRFGPDPTRSSASDTAMARAIEAVSERGGGIIQIGAGEFKFDSPWVVPSGVSIDWLAEGRGSTLIDFTGVNNSNGAIYGAGSLESLGLLGEDLVKGDREVVFAEAPDLEPGDEIMIFDSANGSYNPVFNHYKAGEYFCVAEVDGATVRVTSRAFANYAAGGTRALYKLNPTRFSVRGMKALFRQGVSNPGIKASLGSKVVFDDLDLSGSRYTQILIDRCFGFGIKGVLARDFQEVSAGLNYGALASNSQRGLVSDCEFETSRHGYAHGGGSETGCIPYRDMLLCNSIFGGSSNSMFGLDFHANGEHCRAVNCQMPAGMDFSADHLSFSNCGFWGNVTGEAVFQAGNALGNNISFNRCDFHATMEMANGCLVQLLADTRLSRKSLMSFDDCHFYFGSFLSDSGLTAGILWLEGVTAHASCEEHFSATNCKFFTDSTEATALYGVALKPQATRGLKSATLRDNKLNKCGLWADGNIEVLEMADNRSIDALAEGIRANPITAPSFAKQYWKLEDNTILRAKSTGMFVDMDAATHRIEIRRNKSLNNVQGGTTGSSTTDSSLFLRNAKSALVEGNIFGDDQAVPTQARSWAADGCAELIYRNNEEVGALARSLVGITSTKYRGSVTVDLSSIADGATGSTNVTVPGVVLGDFVTAACNFALPSGVSLVAFVTGTDTARVVLINNSGAPYDPPSATYTVLAHK